jgi:hypothetical protein
MGMGMAKLRSNGHGIMDYKLIMNFSIDGCNTNGLRLFNGSSIDVEILQWQLSINLDHILRQVMGRLYGDLMGIIYHYFSVFTIVLTLIIIIHHYLSIYIYIHING